MGMGMGMGIWDGDGDSDIPIDVQPQCIMTLSASSCRCSSYIVVRYEAYLGTRRKDSKCKKNKHNSKGKAK